MTPIRVSILILFLCSVAAAQDVRILETFPDGSKRVSINGVEYRALTGEQVEKLALRNEELKRLQALDVVHQERFKNLGEQIASLKTENTALANQVDGLMKAVKQQGDDIKALLASNLDLRESNRVLIDAVRNARAGGTQAFFEKWWVQMLTKAGVDYGVSWYSNRDIAHRGDVLVPQPDGTFRLRR